MGRFWDARAREDALYFINNTLDYGDPDEERFWASGPHDLDALLELLGTRIEAADSIVEIGCGVGRMTRCLAERGADVRALDVSAEMLTRARAYNPGLDNVRWIPGDGASLAAIEAESADVCLSYVVFQHIPDPEITLGYVREIGRVLRPGGWAGFQVSDAPAIHRRRPLTPRIAARIASLRGAVAARAVACRLAGIGGRSRSAARGRRRVRARARADPRRRDAVLHRRASQARPGAGLTPESPAAARPADEALAAEIAAHRLWYHTLELRPGGDPRLVRPAADRRADAVARRPRQALPRRRHLGRLPGVRARAARGRGGGRHRHRRSGRMGLVVARAAARRRRADGDRRCEERGRLRARQARPRIGGRAYGGQRLRPRPRRASAASTSSSAAA